MTIEIVLTGEQAASIPEENKLVVFVTPDGRHLGRLDRSFDEAERKLVEEILERRRNRDPNAKRHTLEEIFEMHRALETAR